MRTFANTLYGATVTGMDTTPHAMTTGRLIPEATTVAPVEQELSFLADSIERLHSGLSTLESRLGPALADFPPSPPTATLETRRHGSELANRLVDVDSRINTAAERVGMLLSRLEL